MVQGACQHWLRAGVRAAPAVAPGWHTLLLLAWLVGAALLGVTLGSPATPVALSRIWGVYAPLSLAALCFALYVTRLGLGRSIFWSLWGRAPRGRAALATELALGVGAFALVLGIESVASPDSSPAVRALLPTTTSEKLAWLATSLVVGVSEELVYRGYLQRQLGAWLNLRSGVALQAALFALAHLGQGPAAALRIGCYGLLFGVLTVARGGLTSAVVAHVLVDEYAGLIG